MIMQAWECKVVKLVARSEEEKLLNLLGEQGGELVALLPQTPKILAIQN